MGGDVWRFYAVWNMREYLTSSVQKQNAKTKSAKHKDTVIGKLMDIWLTFPPLRNSRMFKTRQQR